MIVSPCSELRGVSKVYGRAAGGRVEALIDLSFEVKADRAGRSWSGPVRARKSTLLRLVAGEERPTRGSVLVDGVEVGTLGAARARAAPPDLGILRRTDRSCRTGPRWAT
jgi:ABC-type methionine transport system ATPase subunit